MKIILPVHLHALLLVSQDHDLSPQLRVCMPTDAPVQNTYQFILILYISTYLPENKSTCLILSLGLPYHKDLLLDSAIHLHADSCICSWPYLFILILSFQLITKIYPSTFLMLYMSTYIPAFVNIHVRFESSFSV